jgi:hypothetical protein
MMYEMRLLCVSRCSLTFAPKARQAAAQDWASRESRGWLISEMPPAREAMSNCRMVWDFDAGIRTVPEKVWGLM